MYFTTLCLCTLIRVCTLAAVSPPQIQLHSEVKNAVYIHYIAALFAPEVTREMPTLSITQCVSVGSICDC